jgi:hypothetical protein
MVDEPEVAEALPAVHGDSSGSGCSGGLNGDRRGLTWHVTGCEVGSEVRVQDSHSRSGAIRFPSRNAHAAGWSGRKAGGVRDLERDGGWHRVS